MHDDHNRLCRLIAWLAGIEAPGCELGARDQDAAGRRKASADGDLRLPGGASGERLRWKRELSQSNRGASGS
jgi:hypothetical protein